MAVKIRMTRMGRRHRPFFRIVVIDSREPRDGKILEKLGHYDPLVKDKEKQIILDLERVKFWLGKGAVPSDTISEMLLKLGVKHKYAEQKAARRLKAKQQARAKGKPFTRTEEIALKKAEEAEAAKVEAEAKAKEEAEKAKAEAEKAKAEAEAKAKEEAEKAKAEAEKAKAEAEAKAKEEAEAKAEPEAEAAE